MCRTCWTEYGAPTLDSPAIQEAKRAIAAVFENGSWGGALRVVLQDFSLEDWCLEICESLAGETFKKNPANHYGHYTAEIECITALRRLSLAERASALARHENLIRDRGWDSRRLPAIQDATNAYRHDRILHPGVPSV